MTRKYGVESTTTITLFDPAAFFATDATDTDVSASSGPTDESGEHANNRLTVDYLLTPDLSLTAFNAICN